MSRAEPELYIDLREAFPKLLKLGYPFDFITDSYKRIRDEYDVRHIRVNRNGKEVEYFVVFEKVSGDDIAGQAFRLGTKGYVNTKCFIASALDCIFKYEYNKGERE